MCEDRYADETAVADERGDNKTLVRILMWQAQATSKRDGLSLRRDQSRDGMIFDSL